MPTTSAFYECLESVKTIIEGLSTGITNTSIVIQPVAHYKGDQPKPFISISPYGPEGLPSGTNAREDIVYPVLVAIIADKNLSGGLDALLTIRQKIRRRFLHQGLSGITLGSLIQTTVTPGNTVEVSPYLRDGVYVSGLILNCEVRELRS